MAWSLDVMVQPEHLEWGFVPGECKNNKVEATGDIFFVTLPDSVTNDKLFSTAISCNVKTDVLTGEASAWNDPVTFKESRANELPLLSGAVTPRER